MMTWRECYALWDAKGYKVEVMEQELQKRFPQRRGLSRSSLATKSKIMEHVPEDIAEAVRELPVLDQPRYQDYLASVALGAQDSATVDPKTREHSIAQFGQQVAANIPVDKLGTALAGHLPKLNMEELAQKVASKVKLDTNELAQKMAELADRVAERVMATLPKVRILARLVSVGVAGTISRAAAGFAEQMTALQQGLGQVVALLGVLKNELGQVATQVGQVAAQLGQVVAQLGFLRNELAPKVAEAVKASVPQQVDPEELAERFAQLREEQARGNRKLLVALGGCYVVIPLLVLACLRLVPPAVVFMNGVVDREKLEAGRFPASFLAYLRMSAAVETGEKVPPERYVPDHPLPGQKLAPCDSDAGESILNGGCWGNMGDVKPPCRRLYRSGDKCYRPIAADPSKPMTEGDEQHPRPGQRMPSEGRPEAEMPGKEE